MSLIIAHRGASHHAPENTLSAFRAAAFQGADGIETDVHFTSDGQLVTHHSYSIDGCSNGQGAIQSLSLAQLKQYDFGRHKGDEWAGETIPTLDECLSACANYAMVNIELKAPFDRRASLPRAVVDVVRAHGMVDQVIISAFDHGLLQEVKQLCPQMRTGMLTMPATYVQSRLFSALKVSLPPHKRLIDISREDLQNSPTPMLNPDEVGIPSTDAVALLVELAHQIGAVYPAYTLGQAEEELKKQADLMCYIKELGFRPNYLHCHYSAIMRMPELVQRLKYLGVGVNPWTVDRAEDLHFLSDLGCDAIITNRPDILAQIQASNAL